MSLLGKTCALVALKENSFVVLAWRPRVSAPDAFDDVLNHVLLREEEFRDAMDGMESGN
mgnify:CR=1 FL=1